MKELWWAAGKIRIRICTHLWDSHRPGNHCWHLRASAKIPGSLIVDVTVTSAIQKAGAHFLGSEQETLTPFPPKARKIPRSDNPEIS